MINITQTSAKVCSPAVFYNRYKYMCVYHVWKPEFYLHEQYAILKTNNIRSKDPKCVYKIEDELLLFIGACNKWTLEPSYFEQRWQCRSVLREWYVLIKYYLNIRLFLIAGRLYCHDCWDVHEERFDDTTHNAYTRLPMPRSAPARSCDT
jgi:hypothetical protein